MKRSHFHSALHCIASSLADRFGTIIIDEMDEEAVFADASDAVVEFAVPLVVDESFSFASLALLLFALLFWS